MDYQNHVKQLALNKTIFQILCVNITQEQAQWQPSDDRWTLLEALCHLYDIEREDFRYELEMIFYHPQDPWPNFSIEDWRVQRKYNEKDVKEVLANFLAERDVSISILQGYENFDFSILHSGNAFKGEAMSAGNVLVSWVAHDLYHIRQISLLCWDILKKWSLPFSPDYSGFEAE